jgi:trigger factor
MSLEQYMQGSDLDPQTLRDQFREQAERNLAMRLGLDAVAAAERLEVTDDERTEEVERLAARMRREPDDIRASIDEGSAWKSVDGDILRSKALDFLVEHAEVTEREEPTADESAGPDTAGSTEKES